MEFLGPLIVGLVGAFLVYVGVQVWKFKRIELLHNFQHANVKDTDKFTAAAGKDILFMGFVMLACAGIMCFGTAPAVVTAATATLIAGVLVFAAIFVSIEYKYNRKPPEGPHL